MQIQHQNFLKISLIFIIILGFNYGVSSQQFLHYDWNNPRGLSDSTKYLAMSNGDYTIFLEHRYRVIIPFLANIVRNLVQPLIPSEQLHWFGGVDAFSFYIINCFFSSFTGLFLYLFLVRLKFDPQLSLLGVFIFLGSRITILATGAPIVDSLYFLSIIIIVYFCLTKNTTTLAILTPILILSKETIIPFLLLPFFVKQINRKLFGVSLLASFVVFFWVRDTISSWSPNYMENNDPIFNVVVNHLNSGFENIIQIYFSIGGWHGIFSTFSIFWIAAAFGVWLSFKKLNSFYQIPNFLFFIIPITFGFTILSSNVGRMLLSSFPIVIPYTLIGINYFFATKPSYHSPLKNIRTLDAHENK
jgi:hypothetical protein